MQQQLRSPTLSLPRPIHGDISDSVFETDVKVAQLEPANIAH